MTSHYLAEPSDVSSHFLGQSPERHFEFKSTNIDRKLNYSKMMNDNEICEPRQIVNFCIKIVQI